VREEARSGVGQVGGPRTAGGGKDGGGAKEAGGTEDGGRTESRQGGVVGANLNGECLCYTSPYHHPKF